jgi:hypothetical protein
METSTRPRRNGMAAQDTFENFNTSLSLHEQQMLKKFIPTKRQELFVLRSEEARVRLVHEYIKEVHEMLSQQT